MIKQELLIIVLFLSFTLFGQQIPKDSLQLKDYQLIHHQFGSKEVLSLRAGTGLQKSFYTEIGLAYHIARYGDTGVFSNDFYSALEWMPDKEKDIYGVKIGYEVNPYLFNLGLEVKYQTNSTKNDFVITPKIGLGVFGDVNLFYGYNISTNNKPFSSIIGNHQVSIVFNFNKYFLSYL